MDIIEQPENTDGTENVNICENSDCREQFPHSLTRKYCSYACYNVMMKEKSKVYMRELRARDGAKAEITKICKNCEEPFATTRLRQVYCKYECYRESALAKNREYMANVRAQFREEHPRLEQKHECELCDAQILKKKKYCDKCRQTALAIYRKNKGIIKEETQDGLSK